MQHRIICFGILSMLAAIPLFPQDIPAGGEPVLPEDAALQMNLQGGSMGRRTLVDVDSMPFDRAVQAETLELPDNTWGVQLSLTISALVDEEDALLAVFYARGVESSQESGEVFSEFIFEKAGDPWDKSVTFPISVVGEWKPYFIPFHPVEDYGAGEAAVLFRLGYHPQTIQIGGLELLNYHDLFEVEDLPRTTPGYEGDDPQAPWRTQAERMIDQYRKSDIVVRILDDRGLPVPNAPVHVTMRKHAYKFGSAVSARMIMQSGANSDRYNEIIETRFNRVVMENDLKWGPWENWDRSTTLGALHWLRVRGIDIRGHCLVWPSWTHTPDDLKAHRDDPEYLESRVLNHIEDEAGALAGMLVDWDVINEPYWNHDVMDILGDETMVDWYEKTREMDSTAVLYLNDNNIVSGGGVDAAHQEHFYDTVEFLLDRGAPLQGLGTQCHFGTNVTPPERIWAVLDRLAETGLEIQATEFDVDSPYENLQVNYTRDFVTAYFAHPATVGILTWGFWAGAHWKPEAAFWDEDWNLRPHGEVWMDLVFDAWWTDEQLLSDGRGEAHVRGFLGDYEIQVNGSQGAVSADFMHPSNGTVITVRGGDIEIGHGVPSDAAETVQDRPASFALGANYPNPFNPDTVIPFTLARPEKIRLAVHNTRGRLIRVLVDGEHPAGRHGIAWNGKDRNGRRAGSGIYLVRMQADGFSACCKITLLR